MFDGWSNQDSPFHEGERQVQERLGVRDKIETFARRVVRDHMPDQHRDFYAQLPFVLIGSVDDQGRPWASIVAGSTGFMSTPDAKTLDIGALPLSGALLQAHLSPGQDIGLLGLQPETRRRNRLTGRIDSVRSDGFTINIDQAFGNCPQYIQTRGVDVLHGEDTSAGTPPVHRSHQFDDRTRALIESADTLFIATAYGDGRKAANQGADVSHRGGKPGFVKVDDDRTFTFPDFSGNNHFNTVGNIVLNPKAGFLFIDFEARDLIYMTGTTEIIWEGADVLAFAGAERLIRFRADEVIRVESSLPLCFDFGDYSPMLDLTGSWQEAEAIIAADQERNVYLDYEIVDIIPESDLISSFHLCRVDGKSLASYEPGQFLPIRLALPGKPELAFRTYTVSDAPGADSYRLSIKREGGDALVSNFFHDQVQIGDHIQAMAPRGKFILNQASDRPVVLISAGVGITPMIAMTNFIINEGARTRNFRRTYFIHGARNSQAHAFACHVRDLADEHDNLIVHTRYSAPTEDDRLAEIHDSEGHVDIALLKRLLPLDDYDFYLCGPQAFMQSLYDGLIELGIRGERIHYESFGTATVLKHDAAPTQPAQAAEPADGPVAVRFAGSDIDTTWTPGQGTLLDLAEAAGLNPNFSCRSGICGTCATSIKCGHVDYLEEPTAPHGDDEVLICCSTPRSATGEGSCGENHGIVLEL